MSRLRCVKCVIALTAARSPHTAKALVFGPFVAVLLVVLIH